MDARSPRTAYSTRLARTALATAAVSLTAGCLFETTPPKPRPGTMPPPAQNEAIVSGLVQTRNSVNGNINIAPGHGVLVNWYRRDVTGDGLPDIVSGGPVLTNSSGVYESHYVGADVVQVSVAGRVCTLPDTPDCCLDPLPCGDPTCTVLWGPTRTLAVTPGSRVQQNLTIGCP